MADRPPSANVPHSAAKLEIEYRPLAPEVYEVRLAGEVGLGSVPSIQRVIKNIFDQNIHRIVFNLEAANYLASAGIGLLLSSSQEARDNGGDAILVGVSSRVKHVLDLMGLTDIFRFAPTVRDAVKLLQG